MDAFVSQSIQRFRYHTLSVELQGLSTSANTVTAHETSVNHPYNLGKGRLCANLTALTLYTISG
jgi:hypothetical protein